MPKLIIRKTIRCCITIYFSPHSHFNPSCQAFLSIILMKLKTRVSTVILISVDLKDNALPALSLSVSFLSPSLGWDSQHSRGFQCYKKRLGGKAIKDYFKAQKNPYNTYDILLPAYKKGFGSLFLHL